MSEQQTSDVDTVDVDTVDVDTIDPEVVAAFQALEATVPGGHLDDFESRLLARLEEETMSEMTNETAADQSAAAGAGPAVSEAEHEPTGSDTELRDIRELAESAKKRISKRMEAQPDPDDLAPTTSSPALSIVSLPEPGKVNRGDATALASAAANDDDAGLPAWIYAAISAVAAAAIVFFILRGHKPAATEQVAIMDTPAGAEQAPYDRMAPTAPEPGTVAPGSSSSSATAGSAAAGSAQGDDAERDDAERDDAERDGAGDNDRDQADTGARTGRRTAAATRSSAGATRASRSGAGQQSETASTRDDTDKQAETTTDTAKKDTKAAKKPDALEDLLAEASGGAAGTGDNAQGGTSPAETKPTRTRLDSSDIKKAMAPIVPKAQACYGEFQVPGMVTVSFSVDPSGKITSSKATGKFKGTDTGKCVASAVKSATLPAYNGAPMTFQYPFLLTQ